MPLRGFLHIVDLTSLHSTIKEVTDRLEKGDVSAVKLNVTSRWKKDNYLLTHRNFLNRLPCELWFLMNKRKNFSRLGNTKMFGENSEVAFCLIFLWFFITVHLQLDV
jgi:hypothetical protein